ncbi:unnamed protein product, partial [Mesorhabditis belari]|uniref:Uncharacterized protein n=1 Tax=Mesorhabditis belari TaxID=2138241 RepID=A0AAF3J9Z4_9BILA
MTALCSSFFTKSRVYYPDTPKAVSYKKMFSIGGYIDETASGNQQKQPTTTTLTEFQQRRLQAIASRFRRHTL